MGQISRIGRIGLIGVILAAAAAVWAATTYTAPPPASSHSGSWALNRYAAPEDGLVVIETVTASVADQTIALDDKLAGYLQRVVATHNGNDTSWTLTVTDASGVAIFSQTCNAAADPNSFVCNYGTGGIPFADGLSVGIAGADGGTGTSITVRLYVREAWRR